MFNLADRLLNIKFNFNKIQKTLLLGKMLGNQTKISKNYSKGHVLSYHSLIK